MAAINIINPADFYSNDSEKIKLNWFLYELAMAFYDNLEKPLKKMFKAKGISDSDIAKFSLNTALEFKGPICDFSDGKIDHIEFQDDFFVDFLPPLSRKNYNQVVEALQKAWDEHLDACCICPTRCISERGAYCNMFDEKFFN